MDNTVNSDPTIAISLDYLVEFSDDAQQPALPESAVIIIPPAIQGAEIAPAGVSEPGPKV